jgi:hypothetical protein
MLTVFRFTLFLVKVWGKADKAKGYRRCIAHTLWLATCATHHMACSQSLMRELCAVSIGSFVTDAENTLFWGTRTLDAKEGPTSQVLDQYIKSAIPAAGSFS